MSAVATAFLVFFALTLAVVWVTAPAGLSWRRKAVWIAGGLAVAFPLGQAHQNPRAFYPFIAWTMYDGVEPWEHKEYIAVDARGQEFLYPFALVSFSSPWAVMARIDELIDRCECAAGDAVVDRALQALAAIHADSNSAAIVRIEAYENWTGADDRRLAYVWMAGPLEEGSARRPSSAATASRRRGERP